MASLLEREKIEVYRYNWFAVIFVTAAALAAQWTLPLLSSFFSNFDLPLLVTIYFALARRSPVGGMMTGCILGLIQDAMSGRLIGIFGISKTVVGYVASSLGARIDLENPLARFLLTIVFYLLHQAVYAVVLRGMVGQPYPLRIYVLGAAIVNGVVGALLFAVLDRLRKRIY